MDPLFLEGAAVYDVRLPTRVIRLPILYQDVEALLAFFPIDADRAQAVLPAGAGLRAVRASPRKAVLVLAAFDYKESTVGSYGEVAIGILAARRRLPPLVGVLAERHLGDVGIFVVHLPVTTEIALEAGKTVWGYPKFLADIRFGDEGPWRTCELSENGALVLRLSVRRDGRSASETRAYRTYTTRDGKLLRTSVLAQAEYNVRHGPRAARLELGPHAIGREVAAWQPSPSALEARHITRMQSILPAAEWASPMARAS